MKRFILSLLFLTSLLASYAQDNSLMKRIQSLGSSRVDFTLSADDAQGREVFTQKWTLYYQDGSYRLELETDDILILCDGNTRWLYQKSFEEVVVMKNDYQSVIPVENPMLMFTDSKVTDKGDGTYRVVYTDSNDIHYRLNVSSIKQTASHPDSFFKLDVSALGDDVIITDLR